MDNDVRQVARKKFAGSCRVCPVCNGVACAGEVPGMGGVGTGSSFCNNVLALANCRLNLRTVHAVKEPNLTTDFLGLKLSMPIMAAPIGGIPMNMNHALTEAEYAESVVEGALQAGTLAMTGDGPKGEVFLSGLKVISEQGGQGIPFIKPRDVDVIVDMAKQASRIGAKVFGIDIDAATLINMVRMGQKVSTKTSEELAYIKKNTDIPFIVKGIMTADDALRCCQAGVDAIVVSNHGGRVLDGTPGTAEVLPYIAEAVKGKMTILVDGGIRSGADVLKMLALGADAVLIGRPIAVGAVGQGANGVKEVFEKFAAELRSAMILTATADVNNVSADILWKPGVRN